MSPANSQPTFKPSPKPGTVIDDAGHVVAVPEDWELLQPGDPGLTRRVKAAGQFWKVEEKKGRKIFSRGIYAPKLTIDACRQKLEVERGTETYQRRRVADKKRRDTKQEVYVDTFETAVIEFLGFDECHQGLAKQLAAAVTRHATPVGSGTVARTQRIPVEQRAASAVIAWMRHQTTAYDSMKIPNVKGARREVRRMLANRSQQLLMRYRQGKPVDPKCPLILGLKKRSESVQFEEPTAGS